jgi:predicted nuclease of restriction endonuclease-like (RecB) superfamily
MMEKLPIDKILINDLKQVIEQARSQAAATVNSAITLMYWHIGERINREILGNERAEYGKQIIATVSQQLQEHYGSKGFEKSSITRMMKFAELFPNFEIVSTLSTQLTWSHFVEILPLKDELQREFYLTMASFERWTVRMLRDKIDGILYERTLISGKPDEMIKLELSKVRNENIISPDIVFRSPYFFEFTGLKGAYNENSLEDSLIARLEQFILELGVGFTFVERQKRMVIDGEDFHLDLLFYHRKLHRLIAVELKLGRFKAAYKGQMELYLRWLEKYEVEKGEESPLGLILCADGGHEQIELLKLDAAGIKIAKYLTELPEKSVLQAELRKELNLAKQQFGKLM